MAKQVESVYGEALFEFAAEHDMLESLLEEAGGVRDALSANPELARVMEHPRVTKDEKKQLLETVFSGRISDELLGLLVTIVEKDHFGEAAGVLDYFIGRVREYRHIGLVHISTPMPLSDTERDAVERKLLETTGYATLETDYTIEPELIGGMVIRIGDRVVDSSVRTKLEHLSRELAKIQLKVGEGA